MIDDYGKSAFKEIGTLSSQLPAYVRQCCRSMHDGTDTDVLEEYRSTAYRVLVKHQDRYKFVKNHLEILRMYSPEMVKEVIMKNNHAKLVRCLVVDSSVGLPKRACLHCPKVGTWLTIMNAAGKINDATGERNDYK